MLKAIRQRFGSTAAIDLIASYNQTPSAKACWQAYFESLKQGNRVAAQNIKDSYKRNCVRFAMFN